MISAVGTYRGTVMPTRVERKGGWQVVGELINPSTRTGRTLYQCIKPGNRAGHWTMTGVLKIHQGAVLRG